MWRPWVAGLAAGTCQRPYQSAGTNATWPSPWPLGRIPPGRVPGTPMLGPWHGKASAASHDPPRPSDSKRQQGAGEDGTANRVVLLRQRTRELLHSLLVCLTSGAGDEEAPSRGKSVDGTEGTWQPGSALPLVRQYCTVPYLCLCVCMCVRARVRLLLASLSPNQGRLDPPSPKAARQGGTDGHENLEGRRVLKEATSMPVDPACPGSSLVSSIVGCILPSAGRGAMPKEVGAWTPLDVLLWP